MEGFALKVAHNPLPDMSTLWQLLSFSVLPCGTGTMTEKLADYGYDMIGVDNSEDMLELAMEKRMESGKDILYLLQDMREFELYGTVMMRVPV